MFFSFVHLLFDFYDFLMFLIFLVLQKKIKKKTFFFFNFSFLFHFPIFSLRFFSFSCVFFLLAFHFVFQKVFYIRAGQR